MIALRVEIDMYCITLGVYHHRENAERDINTLRKMFPNVFFVLQPDFKFSDHD